MYLLFSSLLFIAASLTTTTIDGSSDPAPATFSSDDPFPVYKDLEPRVKFWEFIFGELPNSHFLIHDINNPEIVYSTISFKTIENEKPVETVKRMRSFLQDNETQMAGILRKMADGNTEIVATLHDEQTASHLMELFRERPKEMKTAWKRVHIQRGVADSFNAALSRCIAIKEDVQNTLISQDLPPDLFWLVFVESMCTPNIRSFAGAAGLWQLMPNTARELGLTVNNQRDERLDPVKSTKAAAKFFKRTQKQLNHWPLTITGYNHGPAGVKRLTTEYKSTDLSYLIKHVRKPTFGFASQNFYAEFIAVRNIGQRLLEQEETND